MGRCLRKQQNKYTNIGPKQERQFDVYLSIWLAAPNPTEPKAYRSSRVILNSRKIERVQEPRETKGGQAESSESITESDGKQKQRKQKHLSSASRRAIGDKGWYE